LKEIKKARRNARLGELGFNDLWINFGGGTWENYLQIFEDRLLVICDLPGLIPEIWKYKK